MPKRPGVTNRYSNELKLRKRLQILETQNKGFRIVLYQCVV